MPAFDSNIAITYNVYALLIFSYESRTENQSLAHSMPEASFSRKNMKVLRPIPTMGSDVPEDVSILLQSN